MVAMRKPTQSVAAFYRGISFTAGGAPDWLSVSALFLPGAKLTLPHMPDVEGICSMTVREWSERFASDVEKYSVISFEEHELRSTVFSFADIAHVLSSFETKVATIAAEQVLRGLYSIQLVRSAGKWL